MRSCPVLANITRCPQTRRAPSVRPRTAGPEPGRCPRCAEGPAPLARRGGPGRSSAGGQESNSVAATPPWTFIRGCGGGGKEGFRKPGASPRTYGKGPTKDEPGAPASRQHLLQTPCDLVSRPSSRCAGPVTPRGAQPAAKAGAGLVFVFKEINQSAKQVLLKGVQKQEMLPSIHFPQIHP